MRDVSFDVAEGEIFGLLGPNGAGKTTTIECILGLRQPDSGSIRIDGIDAIAEPVRAKERIGAVLQFNELQHQVTVREALRFFGSFYPLCADIDALLAQVNLSEKADHTFGSLAGGERRRLELALALVHEPRVLFLDEPTAGLDPMGRHDLHAIIAGLKSAGRAILLTTHLIDEAHRLCDRVAIIDQGRIRAMDSPAALIAGAKTPPRLIVRTKRTLSHQELRSLAGVGSCEFGDESWRVETSQMTQTIEELMKLLQSQHNELLDLRIHRPTLEDVFIDLTGRKPPEERE